MQITTEIINGIIIDYINRKNTNYAVLISGKWGSGKTYYWKNLIVPLISQDENCKHLLPIYISLNGLEKPEQISQKIVNETLRSKTSTLVDSKTFDKLSDLVKSASSYLKMDIKPENFMDFIDFSKTIICFDDLERYSKKAEVLGYINDFVEHKHAKVFVLANEEKIKDDISELKEKVIGKTITFQPDCKKIISDIISSYPADPQKFLLQEIDCILDILNRSNSLNFRIMRSALDDYVYLYQHGEEYNKELFNKAKLPLLQYTLSVALELRLGQISNEEKTSLLNANMSSALEFHVLNNKKDAPLPYFLKFIDKYWGSAYEWNYWFPSVLEYLIEGAIDTALFDNELERYKEQDYPALNYLFEIGYWKMTDAQFNAKIKTELMENLSSGKICLSLYPRVFFHLSDLAKNGLLGCTLVELETKCLQGIDTILKCNSFERDLDDHVELFSKTSLPQEYIRVRDYAQNANEELLKKQNKQKVNDLFSLLSTDIDQFANAITDSKEEYYNIPVFTNIDLSKVYDLLVNVPTEKIIKLRNSLEQRYELPNPKIIADYPNMKKLGELILSNYPESPQQSLNRHLLRVLGESLIKLSAPQQQPS